LIGSDNLAAPAKAFSRFVAAKSSSLTTLEELADLGYVISKVAANARTSDDNIVECVGQEAQARMPARCWPANFSRLSTV
jgi:hypothetical protein